jgi:hypothetical protein
VKSFASKVAASPRVDAVVLNASIVTTDREIFEGHESTITVKVISTMLLVLLLLSTMRASAEKFDIVPIIHIVCSDIRHWSPFRERDAPNIFAEISDKNLADMSIERLVNPQIPTSSEPLTASMWSGSNFPSSCSCWPPEKLQREWERNLEWFSTS